MKPLGSLKPQFKKGLLLGSGVKGNHSMDRKGLLGARLVPCDRQIPVCHPWEGGGVRDK